MAVCCLWGGSVDFFFFFFSSRRRHTRYWRDWSSDVCSSDLHLFLCEARLLLRSGDGEPILPHRLQLPLVDEPIGVYRHATSRFVHHGIDFSKGSPIAHKAACVIVASHIVLADED